MLSVVDHVGFTGEQFSRHHGCVNHEFLAVLGDQTHGNNIEAPEGLIRKIVREESGGSSEIHVTIVLDSVTGKKLFDTVVRENNAVVRATGASPLVM